MSDLTPDKVLYTTNINWDEKTIIRGRTPVKNQHYDELEEVVFLLKNGLVLHEEDNARNQHGEVTPLYSGYMTPELVNRIQTIINNLNLALNDSEHKLSPAGIIVMQEKKAENIEDGWVWCNGVDTALNSRNTAVLGGYDKNFTYPIHGATESKYEEDKGIKIDQQIISVTFMKRV